MNLDLSWAITSVIAVCALVSPIITTMINNRHQKQMKILEYQDLEKQREEKRISDIYEGFLQSAGSCIQCHSKESLEAFGAHCYQVFPYVPATLQGEISSLNYKILSKDWENASSQLEFIAVKLKPFLQRK